MNFDRSIRLPDLILFILVLNFFFAKKVRFWNSVTSKLGDALEFSLQIGNQKPQRSDFDSVCKANNGT